uniref:Uncharacterized protein n=1 Tax=Anopheles albimanus TaxID=7167 RepID=A0A182FXI6_ANOAL
RRSVLGVRVSAGPLAKLVLIFRSRAFAVSILSIRGRCEKPEISLLPTAYGAVACVYVCVRTCVMQCDKK